MKKLGTLFGCDLLIDTDDVKIQKLAESHMEELVRRSRALSDIDLDREMAKRFPINT